MNTIIVREAMKLENKIIRQTKEAGFKYLAIKHDGLHFKYKQTNSEVAKKILSKEGYEIYNVSRSKDTF